MTQRERESLARSQYSAEGDVDPHSLLFGDDEESFDLGPQITRAELRHSDQASRRRKSRRGRWFVLLAVVLVAAVAAVVVPKMVDYFSVADYSGSGSGSVTVVVHPDDNASDIGATLYDAGVVKSAEAFTDAAANNDKSQSIQPGTYRLHKHMSGKAALNLLLDPTARDTADDALVPEGATTLDVAARLEKICGRSQAAAITKALSSGAALGIPVSYAVKSKLPRSAEGFLFPATYPLDPPCQPADILQKMVSRFIEEDRSIHFAATAQQLHLTPYDALIIASIAQSEAKFAADMPKVVRTILDRLKADRPLQFDSTSSYGCKLNHIKTCIYAQVDGPYNTYVNKGLPPTPINNPGAEAMSAAVTPAKGNWLYFVNIDSAGHLGFFDTAASFEKARVKCAKNHWGCG